MYPVTSVSDPPTSPPVITGYGGEPLYQGATRDVTCTVSGGNPPVAAVTFTCGGQGQEVSGTSRTITVTADRSNHGSTCTCRARWKTYNPGWYTQTADVTLTVFCEYACMCDCVCLAAQYKSYEGTKVKVFNTSTSV